MYGLYPKGAIQKFQFTSIAFVLGLKGLHRTYFNRLFLPNYLNQSDIKSSLDTIQSSYYLENSISESSVKIEHQFSNRKPNDIEDNKLM